MAGAAGFATAEALSSETPARPEGRYLLHYGDLRTGRLVGSLPVSSCDFTDGINGAGSVTATVGPHARTAALWRATPPGKTMWVVEWTEGRRLCAGGMVLPRSAGTDRFTLGGGSIHSVLARRKVYPPTGDIPTQSVAFTDLDLGSIMRSIVAHVTPAGTARELPISLEPARTGVHTRTYPGYELPWAAALIDALTDDEPAPGLPGTEFRYEPRLVDDKSLEFMLVTGTQGSPQLVNAVPWKLDGTAKGQQVVGEFTAEDDASTMGMRAWAKGGGSEAATVIKWADDTELTAGGWPLLEVERANNSTDGAGVQGYANQMLGQSRRPLRAVTVDVSAAWWWAHGRCGDSVRLVADHRVMGRLSLVSRVLNVAGRFGSRWVTLTLADTIAEEL